jgi:hypothetical protein
MKNRVSVSSSGPFLIELLIGLAVFALAAAICVQVFVGADRISNESSNLNNAMLRAQSSAEIFKAANGDLYEIATFLEVPFEDTSVAHGTYENGEVRQYFDSDWRLIVYSDNGQHADIEDAEFVLKIRHLSSVRPLLPLGYIEGEIIVSDISGNAIFALEVAVLEVTP